MKKTLYDLTKDDWNTLFPIHLVAHDRSWKNLYKDEKSLILEKLGTDNIIQIEHFGSTSIPNIKAKPYIDILIEIPEVLLFDTQLIKKFEEIGYTYFLVPKRDHFDAYMSFGKGYNLQGISEQIYHIHMCPKNNLMWEQIAFRDYLINNPKRAKAYEQLKMGLATKHKNDRGGYVLSKTDFVHETLAIIKANAH
ncbi:GrpB family protein [Aquimarina sp. RZ0]|uniref:GrpB family protein n=1 Tax=Aquimarina sp. RZ0 TaxID=2607730 RepID=UPI0011F2595D|nr:GrpB family protein [Aquimarina sp. RZ0]KAA1246903.1 GrpB family protein [Aquimarina sp. RZ0]